MPGEVREGRARAPPATSLSSLEQPVEPTNLEIWFPRLIVVPVYSQEVAGVRKEKERLTAAADSFSFIRTRAATFFLTVRGCRVYGRARAPSSPVGTYRIVNPSLMSQRETALWLPLALMWVRFEVPGDVGGRAHVPLPPSSNLSSSPPSLRHLPGVDQSIPFGH